MRVLIIIMILLGAYSSKGQIFNEPKTSATDSVSAPLLMFEPSSITETIEAEDSVQFLKYEIKVLNFGGSVLRLYEAVGSCGCSSVTILNSEIEPMETGKIVLHINLKGLYDDKNELLFRLYTNTDKKIESIDVIINFAETIKM